MHCLALWCERLPLFNHEVLEFILYLLGLQAMLLSVQSRMTHITLACQYMTSDSTVLCASSSFMHGCDVVCGWVGSGALLPCPSQAPVCNLWSMAKLMCPIRTSVWIKMANQCRHE